MPLETNQSPTTDETFFDALRKTGNTCISNCQYIKTLISFLFFVSFPLCYRYLNKYLSIYSKMNEMNQIKYYIIYNNNYKKNHIVLVI